MNFNHLGLKKLICTCYAGSPVSYTEFNDLPLFHKDEKLPYKIEITEVPDLNGDGATDLSDIELLLKSNDNNLTILDGDGDFRSEESIEYLKEADIVVTNPPFSLFPDYILQLIEYDKKFLTIGDSNKLHYQEIFPLIANNKVWLGYNHIKEFMRPDGTTKKFGNVIWFTNLDIEKRHEGLILYKHYNPSDYPKYGNFNAINIDRIADIPDDYYGYMGVPDSFINSYDPDQFEIIGRSGDTNWVFNDCSFFTPPPEETIKKYKAYNKTWRLQNVYLLDDNNLPVVVFSRIFIKRRIHED
jgi:hypothetical protein